MTDRTTMLDFADEVLRGSIDLGTRSARTAALLARCAFEDWLNQQSASWASAATTNVGRSSPTTNSKLVVLAAFQGIEVGESAKRVWHGLSRAVHHHAYELQPSPAEVRNLVLQVRELCASVPLKR
jgi:hypothetical protein